MVHVTLERLHRGISACGKVKAIGLSSHPLPDRPDDGDIDLFVYCSAIPSIEERQRLYAASAFDVPSLSCPAFSSSTWGEADYLAIEGIETWIMYFTEVAAAAEVESIREGRRFRRESGFYPSGRLAMFRSMTILADKDGFLEGIKRSLVTYPEGLGKQLLREGLEAIQDDEDLLRAVTRKDPVFYHLAIDDALDALLQVLYVLNKELFPSRKRVKEHLATFGRLPDHAYARIEGIIRLGGRKRTLGKSFRNYDALRKEVLRLAWAAQGEGK
jgi:hypothetical protein